MEPQKRSGRTTRSFQVQTRELQNDGKEELWVEGYAVRFNSPTVLFEIDDTEYREQISSQAFTDCDMSDVIFNYNHSGKVMARTRNHTLQLAVENEGLFIRARLDGTEEGRKLYDEIKGGYIDRMSFQFTIREEEYDPKEHLWTVNRLKRLYDVSAVDIPAYDDTSIEARRTSILEAEAEDERKRQAAAELLNTRKRKLSARIKLTQQNEKEKEK
jgi:HK97 family phage prohead protease